MTDHSSPLSLREQIERLARNCVYRYAVNHELTPEDEHELIMIGVQSARLTLDAVEANEVYSNFSSDPVQAIVNELRAQLTVSLHSAVSAPPGYNIGPFQIDEAESTITLKPGVYELTVPITFGKLPDTKVEGVTFRMPLPLPSAEPTP